MISNWSLWQMTKSSKVNQTSVRKFHNLSNCPCNTQWLTTENVKLFKTVWQGFKWCIKIPELLTFKKHSTLLSPSLVFRFTVLSSCFLFYLFLSETSVYFPLSSLYISQIPFSGFLLFQINFSAPHFAPFIFWNFFCLT